jgi:hypothetical protein
MSRKKQLYKIRLRPDGQWEHVYDDGSTDMEFHQLDAHSLADMVRKQRENKLIEYHCLRAFQESLLEEVLERTEWREANAVIKHIMDKK